MNKICVVKRDGSTEIFQAQKIYAAVAKAFGAAGDDRYSEYFFPLDAFEGRENVGVEEIQNAVVESLRVKFPNVATKYAEYRDKRERERKVLHTLMSKIEEVSVASSKDVDLKRENANVNGDGAMGMMLRIGSESAKAFYLNNLIDPKFADAHINGDIHIHDLDFYPMTTTCCQIDLKKLLEGGFGTGHGKLREPTGILSASALACIAIQSNQNDQHGGQSIPNFDYGLAPYVAKTFEKYYVEFLADEIDRLQFRRLRDTDVKGIERFVVSINDELKKKGRGARYFPNIDKGNLEGKRRDLYNECVYGRAEERQKLCSLLFGRLDEKELDDKLYQFARAQQRAQDKAKTKTERETYQAMEALVHNLNSMHCLPGSAKIWVKDANGISLTSIQDVAERYDKEELYAWSLNKTTFEAEWKRITNAVKLNNNREMVTLKLANGVSVSTTTNHTFLNYRDGEIVDALAQSVEHALSPRSFGSWKEPDEINIERFGEVFSNTPFKNASLKVSNSLAKLLGLFVGDGSVTGKSQITFTVCDKISESELDDLVGEALGFVPTKQKTYYDGDKIKDYRYNVGSRLCRAFKFLCGENAASKKVPSFVFEGDVEIKRSFLLGYQIADGRKNDGGFCASTISADLRSGLGLLFMQLKALGTLTKTGGDRNLFNVFLSKKDTTNLQLKEVEYRYEAPKYDLSFCYKDVKNVYRRSKNIYYDELHAALEDEEKLRQKYGPIENIFVLPVVERTFYNSGDEYVYDISVEDNENFLTEANVFVHNSRAGAQVPFSSINYGTDVSPEGFLVTESVLLAHEAGLGNGETPIFPIHIFRVKKGINFNEGEPNYYLFKLACRVSARRMFPNFVFQDAPFNLKYYDPERPETEIAQMGCRTRVIGNVHDPEREITYSRGNLSFTSINLPRLAINFSREVLNGQTIADESPELENFLERVREKVDLCCRQLRERLRFQSERYVYNFPSLMGQGCWIDSEKLSKNDKVGEVLKHGTLSVGFIGLAETLKVLCGAHHGESDVAQKVGLKIVGAIRDFLDERAKDEKLNYTALATPAEGLSGRFVRMDKKLFGEIPGVTDKDFYTNSFHVPVEFKISAFDKIRTEAPYHELTNAGHITYVELDGDASQNLAAFEKIVRAMEAAGIGYGAINHPIDRDDVCGFDGIINDEICPNCGRRETKDEPFSRIRRITGYLVGTLDRFNDAKRAEEKTRIKHDFSDKKDKTF